MSNGETNDNNDVPLANPFKSQPRKGHEDTLKYCAWEVLKDFPQGLHVSLIAKEIEARGLRDLSRMRDATRQISSELVRAKEAFCPAPEGRIWSLHAYAPAEATTQNVLSTSNKQDPNTPKGNELVGHRVAVWWKGEKQYFNGAIENYDSTTDTYSVVYDDGDKDHGLKFRNYHVLSRNGNIDVVTVLDHNLDDNDEISSIQRDSPTSKEEGSEWSLSAGHVSCSMDSLTGAEASESTPRKGRKQAQKRKKKNANKLTSGGNNPKTTPNLQVTTKPLELGAEMLSAADVSSVQLKRKNEPLMDTNKTKKARIEDHMTATQNTPHVVVHAGLVKDLKHNLPTTMESEQQRVTDSVLSAGRLRPTKNERIDILDLSRQMRPPENKRPDLKHLTEVGELMSLSELSDELRRGHENGVDMEEVSSAPVRTDSHSNMDIDECEPPTTAIKQEAAGIVKLEATSYDMNDTPQMGISIGQHNRGTPSSFFVGRRLSETTCSARSARLSVGGCDLLSPSILSKNQIDIRPELTPTSIAVSHVSSLIPSTNRQPTTIHRPAMVSTPPDALSSLETSKGPRVESKMGSFLKTAETTLHPSRFESTA